MEVAKSSVKITEEVKKRLDKLKRYRRETYSDVLRRILKLDLKERVVRIK